VIALCIFDHASKHRLNLRTVICEPLSDKDIAPMRLVCRTRSRVQFHHRTEDVNVHHQRWFQFSLRYLFLLVTGSTIPLAWLGREFRANHREQQAVAYIRAIDPSAYITFDGPTSKERQCSFQRFLNYVLPRLFPRRVISVTSGTMIDQHMIHFRDLTELRELSLKGSCVTDDALNQLKYLPQLRALDVRATQITSRGILAFERLRTRCQVSRYERSKNDGVGYADTPVNRHFRRFAPIHEAAWVGDTDTIEQEIARGVPVDLAVQGNRVPIAAEGTTPLMWAAARGQLDSLRCLIARGANVNAVTPSGVTALMAAAGASKILRGVPAACVQFLLRKGADLNAHDHNGRTAAFYACGCGGFFDNPPRNLLSVVNQLERFEDRRRPDGAGCVSVEINPGGVLPRRFLQCRHGDVERLTILLHAGASCADVTTDGTTLLAAAAESADVDRLRVLLNAQVAIKHHMIDAMNTATQCGDIGMFRLLLHECETLNPSLLGLAAQSDEDAAEKVEELLARGVNPNHVVVDGQVPLLLALQYAPSAALPLLRCGANPLVKTRRGENTLALAARSASARVLQALLAHPFDVNEHSRSGKHAPPLILAAASHNDSAAKVDVLLGAGAAVDATDDEGTTAILAASREGNFESVSCLASAGANVNVMDNSGMTPLHYVANRGADRRYMSTSTGGKATLSLIKYGASARVRDNRGRSPRDLARIIGHNDCIISMNPFLGFSGL
jgi:ankyrin repeat protein